MHQFGDLQIWGCDKTDVVLSCKIYSVDTFYCQNCSKNDCLENMMEKTWLYSHSLWNENNRRGNHPNAKIVPSGTWGKIFKLFEMKRLKKSDNFKHFGLLLQAVFYSAQDRVFGVIMSCPRLWFITEPFISEHFLAFSLVCFIFLNGCGICETHRMFATHK